MNSKGPCQPEAFCDATKSKCITGFIETGILAASWKNGSMRVSVVSSSAEGLAAGVSGNELEFTKHLEVSKVLFLRSV